MKYLFRLLTVVLLLAWSSPDALAQSSPPPNPNYTRFNAKADGDIPTPAANVVYLFFNGTGFRFKDSTATFTNVGGAGITGLNTGRIPQAGSSTTIVDSKMLASGTNSGTWTLYDSTATNGRTMLEIREGESDVNSGNYLLRFVSWGGSLLGGVVAGINEINVRADRYDDVQNNNFSLTANNGLYMIDTLGIRWANGSYYSTPHLGLLPSASGILRVTDGSTGFASLRSGNLGVETANGAIGNVRTISEEITLATGGLTTDSAADLLPANSIILSVTARVTTLITVTTSWALGDASESARFASANATLAAGTTTVGLNHMKGGVATDALGPVQVSAAKLRITCAGANPGQGAIRVTVTYIQLTAPTS